MTNFTKIMLFCIAIVYCLVLWGLAFASPVHAQALYKGTVIWVDSEHNTQPGTNAVDGKPGTYWHTPYTNGITPYPHGLIVDLGTVIDIEGVGALPRQDVSANGQIGEYKVYVKTHSDTPPTTPPNVAEWTLAASGKFPNNKEEQVVPFDNKMASRYVWLHAVNEAQKTTNPWTSLAEFTVLGGVPEPEVACHPGATYFTWLPNTDEISGYSLHMSPKASDLMGGVGAVKDHIIANAEPSNSPRVTLPEKVLADQAVYYFVVTSYRNTEAGQLRSGPSTLVSCLNSVLVIGPPKTPEGLQLHAK